MSDLPQEPGIHLHITTPGMERLYIAIPDTYKPGEPTPLVLALHWGGTVTPETPRMLLEEMIRPGLGGLNAVIAAPMRMHESWIKPEAEGSLLTLWMYLREHYTADAKRTLVTGYSMGGIGAWNMGAKYPGLFQTVLAISAQPPASIENVNWSLPVYAIHGSDDQVFPAHYTEERIEQLKEKGIQAEVAVVDGLSHFETYSYIAHIQKAARWVQQVWDT